MKATDSNEIAVYVQRAPGRFSIVENRFINHTHARLTWLASIASGTIDEKINRRAGLAVEPAPWSNPILRAIDRNRRKACRKNRR